MNHPERLPIRADARLERHHGRKPSAWPLFLLILAAFGAGIFLERYGLSGTPWSGALSASPIQANNSPMPSLPEESETAASEDLKRLETEVQKRAAYLASLVDDVKRLNRGTSSSAKDEPIRRRPQGEKAAIGGGKGHSHAYYRFSGTSFSPDGSVHADGSETADGSEAEAKNVNTVVQLSPLLEIDANLAEFAATPIGAPVPGDVTSGYGVRESPFEGGKQLHQGIDFAVDEFTAVLSTADGVVTTAGRMSGYGNTIIVRHKHGVETLYAHLSKIRVRVGDRVCRGQKIGLVGMTGQTTGPHLHYEVRMNGVARNPERFVRLGALISELADLSVVG